MAKKFKKSDDKPTPETRGQKFVVKMERSAQQAMLQDLFNDIYTHRARIYWVNFIRGITFSVGGIIGATVIIALLLWILSLFSNVPFVGQYFKDTTQTIQKTTGK